MFSKSCLLQRRQKASTWGKGLICCIWKRVNDKIISSFTERPTIQDNRKRDKVPSAVSKTQQRISSASSKTKQPINNQKQAQGQSQGQTRSKQDRSSRSSRQMSGDDSSLTVSPTHDTTRDLTGETTRDDTQDTYTSDETTPRWTFLVYQLISTQPFPLYKEISL